MHELKTEINEDKFAAYKWPLYTLQTIKIK